MVTKFVQHDHCRSCYSRLCDFGIVEDSTCVMTFCKNECGQKFHKCKQEDHDIICPHQMIECINKGYGCPLKFSRKLLTKHLEMCPANILICTMEWNRWQIGASLPLNEHKKDRIKQFQTLTTVDKDLDVACAIHDQRILLETVMPNSVLQYYSNLADGIYGTEKDEMSVKNFLNGDGILQKEATDSLPNKFSLCSEMTKTKSKSVKKMAFQVQAAMEEADKLDDRIVAASNLAKGSKCFKNADGRLLNGDLNNSFPGGIEDLWPSTNHSGLNSEDFQHDKSSNQACYIGTEDDVASNLHKGRNINYGATHSHAVHGYIKEFTTTAPSFMALLNVQDSDVSVVIDVVDMLVEKVERKIDGSNLPLLGIKKDEAKLLRQSYDELLQEVLATCNSTKGAASLDDQSTEKKAKKAGRRKKINWSLCSNVTSGGYVSPSWGWMPARETKHVSTDNRDFPIDTSNPEWLSPEASIEKQDLIFRLFSILGCFKGNSVHMEKLTSHYMAESSCQTVAPFLIHLDLNASGRALCNASLSSATKNPQEKHNILSLLSGGKADVKNADYGTFKMSDNLAYNNVALGYVIESVPRYQTKPASMYSFMCGCILRRDQFASHVQNVHCEIMSGLNGWIEQKCPYAIYGCDYSEPRFCPDHRSNAVIYNQVENSFVVAPGRRCQDTCQKGVESSHLAFLDLPYEVHENVLHFLDSFSIRQLSLTCTYLREVCKNQLVTRGVVEMQWVKRKYDVGAPSWQMGKKIWCFPAAFARINRWVLADTPAMVQHVSKCPVIAAQDIQYKAERIKVLFN